MVRQARQLAALPKVSDMLTLSQSGVADYAQPFVIGPLHQHFNKILQVKFMLCTKIDKIACKIHNGERG